MADAPYIPWFTSDFLNGVADLEDREIGIYTIILTLMGDQGGPIDDDPRWIARRSGSTTRRVNQCLNRLAELDKIERKNGVIGNRKMLELIRKRAKKSDQTRAAAQAKWDLWKRENTPSLPFVEDPDEQNSQKNRQKKSGKNRVLPEDKTQKNSPVKNDNPQNSDENAVQTHPDSRGRVNPEPESIKQTIDHKLKDSPRAENEIDRSLDGERDLVKLLETVSSTAGFIPRGSTGHVNAIDQIKEWRDAGIDFGSTVIPTIERIVAKSDDPTSSLRRFDKAVRHEHAKTRAAQNLPSGPPPTIPDPITRFDDEDEDHAELRSNMAEKMDKAHYAFTLNRTKLTTLHRDGKRILRIERRSDYPIDESMIQSMIRSPARRMGWSDVW